MGSFSCTVFLFFAVVAVVVIFVLIPPRPIQKPPPVSPVPWKRRLSKTACFLIPGAFDMSRGSPLRGWFALTTFAFSALSIFGCWQFDFLPGMVSGIVVADLLNAFPWPHAPVLEAGIDMWEHYRWDIFWSWYGAKTFWSVVALSALVSLSLHVARFRKIWKL
jgi:hypothetical protein